MNSGKVKIIALLFSSIGFTGVEAQEASLVTGGNASGNGGSVSYSVGQVVYTSIESRSGSTAQGVQLPFEISITLGFEIQDVNLVITAYPNPTSNNLFLKLKNFQDGSFSYRLYNINGTLLATEKIIGSEAFIEMKTLTPAIYYLKIIDTTSEIKTFKIIKR